jgi:hypothetical protein
MGHAAILVTAIFPSHMLPLCHIVTNEHRNHKCSCSLGMAQDRDEDEMSALEYARYHRLSIRYDSQMTHCCNFYAPENYTSDWNLTDSLDDSVTDNVNALMKEPLAVSKDAAMLLKTIFRLRIAAPNDLLVEGRYQWMLSLRQELPVLQTDDELDLLSFGNAAMPDFKAFNIPFEVTHSENDESLDWSAKYLTFPAQYEQEMKSEKLAISRDVLLFLHNTFTDFYIPEDSRHISEESLQYRRVSDTSITKNITKGIAHCTSASYSAFTSAVTFTSTLPTIITDEPCATGVR